MDRATIALVLCVMHHRACCGLYSDDLQLISIALPDTCLQLRAPRLMNTIRHLPWSYCHTLETLTCMPTRNLGAYYITCQGMRACFLLCTGREQDPWTIV
ncbi:hypothetical protein ABBQ38_004840 [Trebouxia sp. C0009 RCD-2024]